MPAPEKSKLMQFAKAKASPPPVAAKLQEKRAAAKAPPPLPPPAPPSPQEKEAEEEADLFPHELLEEAAEAAEEGKDTELEDALVDAASTGPGDVPAFAVDAEKWKLAAETVGLGVEGTDALYEEPLAVAAYLYKALGGKVTAGTAAAPAAGAEEESEQEMSTPGAAAKAMSAASQLRKEGALVGAAIRQAQENPDEKLLALTKGYEPERDGNPPSWAVDEATWERAKEAVDPEGKGSDYSEPWAVVAHVYKAMGGTIE